MKLLKIVGAVVALAAAIGFASTADAAKPRKDGDGPFLGNGYPSGFHFNLNIHGKRDNFICPDPDFNWTFSVGASTFIGTSAECEAYATTNSFGDCIKGSQAYGNVVNMRRDEDGGLGVDSVEIEFQSGRKGPKGASSIAELRVTDWCSTDVDGDPAVVQLPADPDGYAVYGRIAGKPTNDPTFDFTSRELTLVEDDFGNDLFLLGLVTSEGTWVCPSGENCTLVRVDDSVGGGKGKKIRDAIDLTSLFEFNGSVCYINDDSIDTFCSATETPVSEGGLMDISCGARTDGAGTALPVCCLPAELEPNGDVTILASCLAAETSDTGGYTECQDNVTGTEDLAGTSTSDGGTCVGGSASIECPNDNDGICEDAATSDSGYDEICSYECPTELLVEDPAGTSTDLGGTCDGDVAPSLDCPNDGDGLCEDATSPGSEFDELCMDLVAANSSEVCDVVPVCKDFSNDPVWIFNIESFVNVLFKADNHGSYNVKLRFYPLPLDIDAQ